MCRLLVFFSCGAMPILPFVKTEVLYDIIMRLRRSQPLPQARPVLARLKENEDMESSEATQVGDVPSAQQDKSAPANKDRPDEESSDEKEQTEQHNVSQRDVGVFESSHSNGYDEQNQSSIAINITKPKKKRVRFCADEPEREQVIQGEKTHAEIVPAEQAQEQPPPPPPIPQPAQQQQPPPPIEPSTEALATVALMRLPPPPPRPFPYPRICNGCTCTRLVSSERIPLRCGNCSTCNFRPAPLVFADEHGTHASSENPPTHTTRHGRFDPDEQPASSWGFTGRLEGGGWGRLGTVGGASTALSSKPQPTCTSRSRRGKAARVVVAPESPSLGRLDSSCPRSAPSTEEVRAAEERKKMKWVVGKGGEVVFREPQKCEEQQEKEKREQQEEMIERVFSRIDPIFRTQSHGERDREQQKKNNGGGGWWFFSRSWSR
ncbi:MAG: hypothetical protein Q9160_001525 [Pyrenula sp. 1 TL-2023]